MSKEVGKASLLHNAKRCYVYEYGIKEPLDGKITISKRAIEDKELDIMDAIENRDIEVQNCSKASNLIDLAGIKIDAMALNIFSSILLEYEETGKMPDSIG